MDRIAQVGHTGEDREDFAVHLLQDLGAPAHPSLTETETKSLLRV